MISCLNYLDQCFSNINLHMNHLGILLKCRWCFSGSGVDPKILHFLQARWWHGAAGLRTTLWVEKRGNFQASVLMLTAFTPPLNVWLCILFPQGEFICMRCFLSKRVLLMQHRKQWMFLFLEGMAGSTTSSAVDLEPSMSCHLLAAWPCVTLGASQRLLASGSSCMRTRWIFPTQFTLLCRSDCVRQWMWNYCTLQVKKKKILFYKESK